MAPIIEALLIGYARHPQRLLEDAQKDMQHRIDRGRFALQEVAQALGQG